MSEQRDLIDSATDHIGEAMKLLEAVESYMKASGNASHFTVYRCRMELLQVNAKLIGSRG